MPARSSVSARASSVATRAHGTYGPRTRWCAKRKGGSVETLGCATRSKPWSVMTLPAGRRRAGRKKNIPPRSNVEARGQGRKAVKLRYRKVADRYYVRIVDDVADESRVWKSLT